MNPNSGPETNLAQPVSLEEKEQALHARLGSLNSVIVAYSGGVDSAYLAYAAHAVLGPQMLAVIADSASLARSQLSDARDFAREHGIPFTAKTNSSACWSRSLSAPALRRWPMD